MKLTKEIKVSHERLSRSSIRFLEYAGRNPECLERKNFKKVMDLSRRDAKVQPWPVFINQHTRKEFAEVSVKTFNLLRAVFRKKFLADPHWLGEYYGFPQQIIQYFLTGISHFHISNLLGRGDFVISESGIKCIEFNISSNLGGWQGPLWRSQYMEIPAFFQFLQETEIKMKDDRLFFILFNHLIQASLKSFSHLKDELNLALIFPLASGKPDEQPHGEYLNRTYREVLQEAGSNLKGKVIICDFAHLKFDGEQVFYQDMPVHTLVEYYGGFVPLEILVAFKAKKVLLLNGSVSGLTSNKLNLALLSESEDSPDFSTDERDSIKKHIPWTRKLIDGPSTYGGKEIDLVDFVYSNREKLVLKPASGVGGVEIFVGRKTPKEKWVEKVKEAVNSNPWEKIDLSPGNFERQWYELADVAFHQNSWVVQEHVESLPYMFQTGENDYAVHNAVWGLFVFGSDYAGGFVRVLPKDDESGIINVHRGAEKAIIFEVEE